MAVTTQDSEHDRALIQRANEHLLAAKARAGIGGQLSRKSQPRPRGPSENTQRQYQKAVERVIRQPRLFSKQVACVDYSIAKGGRLVAYRWDGESDLHENKFHWVGA